jgi:phage tail sheath protein FI
MGFLVSPGVQVNEVDLTNVVPAVATSIGAIAGAFQKGPVSSIVNISSEEELIEIFGKPQTTGNQFETFFSAANFLKYTDSLKVVRAESAIVNAGANSGVLIRDDDHYLASFSTGQGSHGEWTARTAGTWANGIKVEICATSTAYEQDLSTNNLVNTSTSAVGDTSIIVDDADASGFAFNIGDLISFYSDTSNTVAVDDFNEYEVTAINTSTNALTIRLKDDPSGAGLQTAIPDDSKIKRRWKYADLFTGPPGTSQYATDNSRGSGDELHVVVADGTGDITGFDTDTAGNRTRGVIETFGFMSKNPSAKSPQGDSIYYPDVFFRKSSFIYWTDHISAGSNWGSDTTTTYTAVTTTVIDELTGGTDDYSTTAGEIELAYDKFKNAESEDINLVIGGSSSIVADTAAAQDTHVTMLVNLVEGRKDCVAFASPYRSAVVGVTTSSKQAKNVEVAADLIPSSSYLVLDSGYMYMYDKYNDVYRFVPLNGSVAGLCANTDQVADAWFSPAGYNRGGIRGAIKLAFNPDKADRDVLYQSRVNPVVNFPGQGVTLFGDKTALTKPSAFDRINVRRLFLVLEKAIATAAKFQLFEFNDEFTRAQFRNLIEPFLRDVQGRRGITDFLVKCDASNNTGEVIDRNEFVADIFVKPARSINFITLNFIATRTGISFSEVGG